MRPLRFAPCIVALALAVAVSRAGAQVAAAPPIAPESVKYFSGSGPASISGRIVANLPGDRVRYFDKWQVFVVPVIAYTNYFVYAVTDAWKNNNGTGFDADPAFLKLARSTISNGDGYFRFSNLPKGTYFVYTVVVIKDGRQETLMSSSFEQTGSTTYLRDGVPIGESPEYGYVSRPYRHDYTCLSTGAIGGAVAVENGEAAKVDLALFGARNDGC